MLDENDDWKGEHLIRAQRGDRMARPNLSIAAQKDAEERAQIIRALRQCADLCMTQAESARFLGITEMRVSRLARQHNIPFGSAAK